MSAWLNKFLARFANESTQRSYQDEIRSLQKYFGNFTGRESETKLIQYLRSSQTNLAPTTLRKRASRLSKLLDYCVEQGKRKEVPSLLDFIPRVQDARKIKCPTRDELQRLAQVLNAKTWEGRRDILIISLMLFEALRSIEVHRLSLGDVEDLGKGELQLNIQGKANRLATIILLPNTERLMRQFICEHFHSDKKSPLFCAVRKPHQRLTTRAIRKRVDELFRKAGIRTGLSTHSLRHSHASILAAKGIPITVIAKRCRHADLRTTLRYINDEPSFSQIGEKGIYRLLSDSI